jgi:DNA-binding HxlR family transcriptional regulator
VIEKHLQALSELPELAPVLRATCQQLSEQWATLVDRNLCQPRKPKRFSWLM